MSCSYYRDFTRDCEEKYPNLLKYKDFVECESDIYEKCLIYHILESDFNCKYMDFCLNIPHEIIPGLLIIAFKDEDIYDFLTKRVYGYCLSKDNSTRCIRYIIEEEGKQPLPDLLPDGINVNTTEPILKQIIVEKTLKQIVE